MSGYPTCPFCRTTATDIATVAPDGVRYECARCGNFEFAPHNDDIFDAVPPDDQALIQYLPAYIRQWNLDTNTSVFLTSENWRPFARAAKGITVPQKLEKLLRLIQRRTQTAGQYVYLGHRSDGPAIAAITSEEFEFLVRSLVQTGNIDVKPGLDAPRISIAGWQKLQPAAGAHGLPGLAFVAMSLDPAMNDAYEFGIKEAVLACGLPEPIRVDRIHHNEKICDRILSEITRCEFVIADFTGHRSPVYFEAGFAKGLGREVIWTCRSNDFKKVPENFDTRQYNHIEWTSPEDLKDKLIHRIRGSILLKRR